MSLALIFMETILLKDKKTTIVVKRDDHVGIDDIEKANDDLMDMVNGEVNNSIENTSNLGTIEALFRLYTSAATPNFLLFMLTYFQMIYLYLVDDYQLIVTIIPMN